MALTPLVGNCNVLRMKENTTKYQSKHFTCHVATYIRCLCDYMGAKIAYATPLLVPIPDDWLWCRDSPGSMLVLGELHHVSRQVAQLEVGEAVVPEVLQQSAAAGRHHVGAAVAGPGRREELAAGVEEAGRPTSVPVLGLGSGRRRDIASAPVCQATWEHRVGQEVSQSYIQRKYLVFIHFISMELIYFSMFCTILLL